MKNNKILYAIIGIVALAMINVIIYISIKEYTIARWINIAGLNLSVIIFWGSGIVTSNRDEKFIEYFRLPIVLAYSSITFLLSIIFIIIGIKSIQVSLTMQIILLCIFIIAITINKMANNVSVEISRENKSSYNKIAEMTKKIEQIMNNIDDRDVYKKVEKMYDSVKNAKLTLSADSTQIDNDIIREIGKLELNIQNKQYNIIDEQLTQINNYILKRNQM